MSKNFTAKTSPKWIVWSLIAAIIVLASIIVMAFAGANKAVNMKSCKTLSVNVLMSSTFYEDEQANIEAIAEDVIKKAGLNVLDSYTGEKSLQSHEIVYVFDSDADLKVVENVLQGTLKSKYPTYRNITVMASDNVVLNTVTSGETAYLVRAGVVCVVTAVLAFAYISLRYKLWNGIVAFVAAIAASALTAAMIILTRVVVTSASVYAIVFATVLSVVLSVFFAAKNRKVEKENGALTDAEALSEAVPVCNTMKLCGAMAASLVVIGVVGVFTAINFMWFAIAAMLGVVAATYAALLIAPSVYLVVRSAFANVEAMKSRYDYKKGNNLKKEVPIAKTEEN